MIVLGLAAWNHEALLSAFDRDSEQRTAAPAERRSAPVKVITQPVQITANDRTFRAVGTGRARLSVWIYPSVSEEVSGVFFEAQQRVRMGDILIQLDDREERLAVKLARVQAKDARSLLSRYELAVKEGGVPESEVDAARAAFEGAELALEQAWLALETRQVKAPFDGIVGIPAVDPGDRVGPETLITGLDDRGILFVDFEIPEALAGALQASDGQHHEITAITPAYPSRRFTGRISALASRVDPVRRTLTARASIDNSDDLLRPGMSFETAWNIPGDDHATVPEIAVQWGRDGSYVWLIRDGVAERTPARVIARKAGRVLLDGPVGGGDQVVVQGVQRLRPNQPVEVVEPDAR